MSVAVTVFAKAPAPGGGKTRATPLDAGHRGAIVVATDTPTSRRRCSSAR